MQLKRAQELAEQAVDLLGDSCERIDVAGGIRRQKLEPHDIEIVCIPKFASLPQKQLTLQSSEAIDDKANLLHLRLCQLTADGVFTFGKPNKIGGKAPFGKRVYRLQFKGEQLDIFVVLPPAQWGVVFTMRTGSAEFTQALMSAGWRFGLHFNQAHLERWMSLDGRPLEIPKPSQDHKLIREVLDTPEEEDVFKALKLTWVEPRERRLKSNAEFKSTLASAGRAISDG